MHLYSELSWTSFHRIFLKFSWKTRQLKLFETCKVSSSHNSEILNMHTGNENNLTILKRTLQSVWIQIIPLRCFEIRSSLWTIIWEWSLIQCMRYSLMNLSIITLSLWTPLINHLGLDHICRVKHTTAGNTQWHARLERHVLFISVIYSNVTSL